MVKKLNNLDIQILELLRQDEYIRPNISKIAKQLHRPITSVHYRVKKLESDKVVKGYYAIVTVE